MDDSGPVVARLFHRLLAAVFLVAWLSLASQIELLIGSQGLLPAAELFAAARQHQVGFAALPSLLRLAHGDGVLLLGTWLGALLALAWLLAVRWPRLLAALSTILYLGYATACRTFCHFQWDNLLIECGALAILLPPHRPSPASHLLFRLLLFKLYFESGIAKWQSPLHDWHDGSAMTYYYETAPLPTRLAWYAHWLPASWHHLESWLTLGLELGVPFLVFFGRRARWTALILLTGFQLINAVTANYGFFVHLALALHVFLLDDRDLLHAAAWLRARLRRPPAPFEPPPIHDATYEAPVAAVTLLYGLLSTLVALASFGGASIAQQLEPLLPVVGALAPFRLVNTYHLFAAITRQRVEPQLEVTSDDNFGSSAGATHSAGTDASFAGSPAPAPRNLGRWTELELRHKPGSPTRAPDFVAPHQPRVDFQLWFYGLGYGRGAPPWVATLVRRLCDQPHVVQPLFSTPLPPHARAVRLRFWDYHFTTPAERAATGAWWRRTEVETSDPIRCR